MKLIRTYKFRLYPTKEQAEILQSTLDVCRWVYNSALQEWRDAYKHWKQHGEWRGRPKSLINQDYQAKVIRDLRQELPELKGIFAHMLANVIDTLHNKTINDFYTRAKAGKKGFPRFKAKSRYDSFTYPDSRPADDKGSMEAESKAGGWNYNPKTKKLTLNQLAGGKSVAIKMRKHRESIGRVLMLHIKREGTCWYACFVISTEKEITPITKPIQPVGIDLGVENLLTLSTGEQVPHSRFLRKSEPKLIAAQQAVSSKKRGSNRRRKAVIKLAKTHRKIANQRKDYLHKVSHNLVKNFDFLAFEDLQIANMVKRPKPKQDEATGQYLPNNASAKAGLNKSILDAGWSMLKTFTEYKAVEAGILLVEVAPHYTSQVCSCCDAVVEKELKERWHDCPHCGLSIHRDHNAAINILKKGWVTAFGL